MMNPLKSNAYKSYKILLRVSGDQAPKLSASIRMQALSASIQGLGFASIVPLFVAVLDKDGLNVMMWLAITTALFFTASALHWCVQNFEFSGTLATISNDIRLSIGKKLRIMPLEELWDKRTGEITEIILGKVDDNLNYITLLASVIFSAVLTPLVTGIALMFIDWRLGLCLLLIFPMILPFLRYIRPILSSSMRDISKVHNKTSAEILEYVQGQSELRLMSASKDNIKCLNEHFYTLENLQRISHKKKTAIHHMVASLVEVGMVCIFTLGAILVSIGELNIAIWAGISVIVVRFSEPISNFLMFTAIFDLIETSLKYIESLLSVEPMPQLKKQDLPKTYDISFNDVSFKYRKSSIPFIQNLNLKIKANSMVAIVGDSGAGKTTILRLLQRQVDPNQGNITIGGVDVRAIAPSELSAMISVVFQDVYLFNDTILENIRIAKPTVSDAEIKQAIKKAGCVDFIDSLENGLNTRIGDCGHFLSGGERQRLSIVRAFLKDSPILLLDEPVSALDYENENIVQRSINALVKKRTVVVISHRLSTVKDANNIVFIGYGRVAEKGTHTDLLKKKSKYYALWNAQFSNSKWHLKR